MSCRERSILFGSSFYDFDIYIVRIVIAFILGADVIIIVIVIIIIIDIAIVCFS